MLFVSYRYTLIIAVHRGQIDKMHPAKRCFRGLQIYVRCMRCLKVCAVTFNGPRRTRAGIFGPNV